MYEEEMIEAFQIFVKHKDKCVSMALGNNRLYAGPDPEVVSDEDTKRLEQLGWYPYPGLYCFYRYI